MITIDKETKWVSAVLFPMGKDIIPKILARELEINWYFTLFYNFFLTKELQHASYDIDAEVQFLIFWLNPSDCQNLYHCQSKHVLICCH